MIRMAVSAPLPQMEDFKSEREKSANFSAKRVFSVLWALNTFSVMSTQFCCHRVDAAINNA